VLAVVLWMFVQGKETLEVDTKAHLSLLASPGLTTRGASVITRDITIRGSRSSVEHFQNKMIRGTYVLPKNTGPHRFRIERRYLDEKWDPQVSVQIHEPYISVNIEEMISKTLPVKVIIQGSPKDGYLVEKIEARPSNVTISGAASYIQSLDHIATQPIYVDNIASDITQEVLLNIPSHVRTMFSENKTFVSVRVGLEKINQLFSMIPIEVQESSLLSRPIPETVSVILQSNSLVLESIETDQLRAFIQAGELLPGHYELDVQVQIPQGTTLIETIPAKVSVTLWEDKELP